MKRALLLLAAVGATGCIDKTDPEWQLDHDRLIAVRASAPHLSAGESLTLDALVAHKSAQVDIQQPLAVAVFYPMELGGIVTGTNTITAPDQATIDSERAALMLAADAPVPVDLVMQFPDSNGIKLNAKKTIYLGDSRMNDAMPGAVTVEGAPIGASVTIPYAADTHFSVDAPADDNVDWLTSVGTMHDDDEHTSFIHIEKTDTDTLFDGQLVLVVRDTFGGVVWQTWPLSAH